MKTKNQIGKWLAMLLLVLAGTMGAMAQVGTLTQTGAQTVCLNSTMDYGVVNTPGSTYTWSITPSSGGTITGNTNVIAVNWTIAGNYSLQVIEMNSLGCEGAPVIIPIIVLPALQPGTALADQTICYNSVPAALTSVDPTGGTGTFTYQWESSIDAGTTWIPITGATSAGYAPLALTATTHFRLNQTSGTCGTVTTNTVIITVQPIFVAGTASADQTVCYNSVPEALTSVDPTGGTGTFTYQWQSSADNVTFTDIGSATLAGFTPGALIATTYYRLQQTSGTCGTVTTNTVIITVQPIFVAGTASADQTICYNSVPAALTSVNPTGGTGTYTYQWESSIDAGATWIPITGATTTGYAPSALTATTQFQLKQTSGTCGTVTTNQVIITVQPNLIAGTASADQTICYNSLPTALTSVDATGGTGTYTYQWESSIDAGSTWTPITGAISAGYTPTALTATTHFHLKQTSGACGTVTTNPVIITVQPIFVAGTISAAQTICYNTAPTALTSVDPTGGTGTFTYQWESSIDAGTTWTPIAGANSAGYAPLALTATTYFQLKQTSGTCGTVTTNAVIITVIPLPVITVNGPSPICAMTAGNVYNTEALMTGYIWTVSAGGTITSGGAATDNTVTVTWNTAGPQTVSVNYKNANGCTATTPTVMNVTVSPLPTTSVIYHN